jgi:hypothetical protein
MRLFCFSVTSSSSISSSSFASLVTSDETRRLKQDVCLRARSTNDEDDRDKSVHEAWCLEGTAVRHGQYGDPYG